MFKISMPGANFLTCIRVPKSILGDRRLTLIYRNCLQLKRARTTHFSSFRCKSLKIEQFSQLSVNWLHSSRICVMHRCITAEASQVPKKENDQTNKTYFEELMFSRKEEAERSVLLHISTKDDIPYALAKCEQFGVIAKAFSYPGEGNNCFVLVEFLNKTATQDLFKTCKCQPMNDIFPVFSRIIQFKAKSKTSLPRVNIQIKNDSKTDSSLKNDCSISDVIEGIYSNEKLTELDTRLRYFFGALVKDSASRVFPYCDVFPFGSSVNGVGASGCDLDLMIRVYPDLDSSIKVHLDEQNDDDELTFFNKTCIGQKSMQQKVVNFLGVYFHTCLPGYTSVQRILNARVPIMKMAHRLLKMECDVSVNNMAAVHMSDVVHFCGEVDPRFRPLLYAVKKWAKEGGITNEVPGAWITNFGLTNLLIFFFQMERILPPLNDAMVILGEDNSPGFCIQYLKSIEEWRNLSAQNKKSLAELFIGFLTFLAKYQFDESIISLMSGKPLPHPKDGVPLLVQYPFDESLNITKNVTYKQFSDLQNKALISANSLEKELNKKTSSMKDFSVLLGIPHFQRPKKVINVNAYFVAKPKAVRAKRKTIK